MLELLTDGKQPGWKSQRAALSLIESEDGYSALEVLLALLDMPEYTAYQPVAEQLQASPTVDLLASLLNEQDEYIRVLAIKALAERGGQEVVEPLIAALHDPRNEVYPRKFDFTTICIEALGSLDEYTPVEELLPLLTDVCHTVRNTALNVLMVQRERSPVQEIIAVLHREYIGSNIIENIAMHIADIPFEIVLAAWEYCEEEYHQWQIEETLETFGKQEPEKLLAFAQKHDHPLLRVPVIYALGTLARQEDFPRLIAALDHEDGAICSAAIEALANFGADAPLDKLLQQLTTHRAVLAAATLHKTHPDVFASIVRDAEAIVRGGPVGGIFASHVQSHIAEFLGEMGCVNEECLVYLRELLDSPVQEVRVQASEALKKLEQELASRARNH